MDRALPGDDGSAGGSAAPAADPLAAEMRHSALLLGWALGSMGLLAVTLLLLTARFGG
jgi:hypothetical protein